jgi:cytochrome c oxidase subunit 3
MSAHVHTTRDAGLAGDRSPAPDQFRGHLAQLGMWIFLATELMFFGPVFLGYAVGRMLEGDAFNAASHYTDIALGTANTMILLTSSAAIAAAVEAVRGDAIVLARRLLWITALLGGAFLAVKGYEYVQDIGRGLFPNGHFHANGMASQAGGRMFFFIYFFATGLHAVHLTIGIGLVLFMVRETHAAPLPVLRRRVEAAGLYWHFVDIVWVFLFPILYLAGRAS